MDKSKFNYVSYVQSTPEKVWNALIDPELTSQYWGNHHNASDWKVGSRWEHRDATDPKLVDIVGKVVESTPPHRLVFSWTSPADENNSAKRSLVTYEIEPFVEGVVRLSVTHDELEPDSEMLEGVSSGWPFVVSCLKTLLETGKVGSYAGQRRDQV